MARLSQARKIRIVVLFVLMVVGGVSVFLFTKPFPQDPDYHNFADDRELFLHIKNTWNVLTNIPFFIVGLQGLLFLQSPEGQPRRSGPISQPWHAWCGIIFFGGAIVTAFGSAYYHWEPCNETLVWDRLPMTLAFMGIVAGLIGERVWDPLGKLLLFPLVTLGFVSVLYWHITEMMGHGDLRLYLYVVQYGSIAVVPLICLTMFPPRYTGTSRLLLSLCLYLLAKVCESLDKEIYALLHFSGHSIKHLLAAYSTYQVYAAVCHRKKITKTRVA